MGSLRRSPSRHYERSRHLIHTNPPTTHPVTMSTAELATSYAALILADDGVEITADKLNTLIQAAKVPDVEPIWSQLFAKALEGKDVKDMLPPLATLLPRLLRRRRRRRPRRSPTRTWASVFSTKRIS